MTAQIGRLQLPELRQGAGVRGFESVVSFCSASPCSGWRRQKRDRARSLDWQTLQVPEDGTHVEYPAAAFAPVREAEKGAGQRVEKGDGWQSYPSTPARMRRTTHLLVISEELTTNSCLITNRSAALSLRFQGN